MIPAEAMEEEARTDGLRFGRLLPGGEAPGSVEMLTGALILGALLLIVLMRKGFRPVLATAK